MSGLGGFFHNGMKRVGIDSGPRADGTRAMEAKRQAGATTMQAVVRGHLGRQAGATRQSAATKMQAVVRGHLGRNSASAESKSQAEAKRESGAVKIQALFRSHQARNNLNNVPAATHHQMLINKRDHYANAKRAESSAARAEVAAFDSEQNSGSLKQRFIGAAIAHPFVQHFMFNEKKVISNPFTGRQIAAFSTFTKEGIRDNKAGRAMAQKLQVINNRINNTNKTARANADLATVLEDTATGINVGTKVTQVLVAAGTIGLAAPVSKAIGIGSNVAQAGLLSGAESQRDNAAAGYRKGKTHAESLGQSQSETIRKLSAALGGTLKAREDKQTIYGDEDGNASRSKMVGAMLGGVDLGTGAIDSLKNPIENAANTTRLASQSAHIATAGGQAVKEGAKYGLNELNKAALGKDGTWVGSLRSASSAVGSAASHAGSAVGSAASHAGSAVYNSLPTFINGIPAAPKRDKAPAESWGDWGARHTKAIGEAASRAGSAVYSAGSAAGSAAYNAGSAAGSAAYRAGSAAGSAIGNTGAAALESGRSAKTGITGYTVYGHHINPWYHAQSNAQKIKIDDHASKRAAQHAASESWGDWGARHSQAIGDAAYSAGSAVGNTASRAGSAAYSAGSAAGSAAYNAGSAAGSAAYNAGSAARRAAYSAGSAIGNTASRAGSAAYSAGSAAGSAAYNAGSAAGRAASNAGSAAGRAIGNAGAAALEHGRSAKTGITGYTVNDHHINPWYHAQSDAQKIKIDDHASKRAEHHEANRVKANATDNKIQKSAASKTISRTGFQNAVKAQEGLETITIKMQALTRGHAVRKKYATNRTTIRGPETSKASRGPETSKASVTKRTPGGGGATAKT